MTKIREKTFLWLLACCVVIVADFEFRPFFEEMSYFIPHPFEGWATRLTQVLLTALFLGGVFWWLHAFLRKNARAELCWIKPYVGWAFGFYGFYLSMDHLGGYISYHWFVNEMKARFAARGPDFEIPPRDADLYEWLDLYMSTPYWKQALNSYTYTSSNDLFHLLEGKVIPFVLSMTLAMFVVFLYTFKRAKLGPQLKLKSAALFISLWSLFAFAIWDTFVVYILHIRAQTYGHFEAWNSFMEMICFPVGVVGVGVLVFVAWFVVCRSVMKALAPDAEIAPLLRVLRKIVVFMALAILALVILGILMRYYFVWGEGDTEQLDQQNYSSQPWLQEVPDMMFENEVEMENTPHIDEVPEGSEGEEE